MVPSRQRRRSNWTWMLLVCRSAEVGGLDCGDARRRSGTAGSLARSGESTGLRPGVSMRNIIVGLRLAWRGRACWSRGSWWKRLAAGFRWFVCVRTGAALVATIGRISTHWRANSATDVLSGTTSRTTPSVSATSMSRPFRRCSSSVPAMSSPRPGIARCRPCTAAHRLLRGARRRCRGPVRQLQRGACPVAGAA